MCTTGLIQYKIICNDFGDDNFRIGFNLQYIFWIHTNFKELINVIHTRLGGVHKLR